MAYNTKYTQNELGVVRTDWDKVPSDLLKKLIKNNCLKLLLSSNNDLPGEEFVFPIEVDEGDIGKLLESFQLFGNEGIVAFLSLSTGFSPALDLQTIEYRKAVDYLKGYVTYENQME